MRTRRFKVDTLGERTIPVVGDEARHALRVLRLGVGAAVTLFDGCGREARGCISRIHGDSFEVELLGDLRDAAQPRSQLVLAVAPPKGERADWLVEKAAELGAWRLVWIQTQRGQVMPGEHKLQRWRRKTVEAAKQAGLAHVMEVEPLTDLASIIAALPSASRYFGSTDGTKPSLLYELSALAAAAPSDLLHQAPVSLLFVVGPEGGLTAAEQAELTQAGVKSVSLGDSILRVETAAIAAVSIWSAWDLTLRAGRSAT